jgi:hypothetical protein
MPGVMGMESFAEAALAAARLAGLDVGGDDGFRVAAVEDMQFLAPCKYYRDEPRTLTVTALLGVDGEDLVARCRLEAERFLLGSDTPRIDVHYTGVVRLTRAPWGSEHEDVPAVAREGEIVGPELIYRLYFHGPAYQVLAGVGRAGEWTVGRMADDLPDNHVPPTQQTVTGPRLSELCFQTAGLYEAAASGETALPSAVEMVRLVRDPNHVGGGLHAVLRARPGDGAPVFDGHVADGEGSVVLRMYGYRTIALPAAMPDDVRGPLHDVLVG